MCMFVCADNNYYVHVHVYVCTYACVCILRADIVYMYMCAEDFFSSHLMEAAVGMPERKELSLPHTDYTKTKQTHTHTHTLHRRHSFFIVCLFVWVKH